MPVFLTRRTVLEQRDAPREKTDKWPLIINNMDLGCGEE